MYKKYIVNASLEIPNLLNDQFLLFFFFLLKHGGFNCKFNKQERKKEKGDLYANMRVEVKANV